MINGKNFRGSYKVGYPTIVINGVFVAPINGLIITGELGLFQPTSRPRSYISTYNWIPWPTSAGRSPRTETISLPSSFLGNFEDGHVGLNRVLWGLLVKRWIFCLKKIWLQWVIFPFELHFVAFSGFLLVGEYLFPKRNHNILGWSVGWVKHDVFFLKRNYPDIGLSSIYIYIYTYIQNLPNFQKCWTLSGLSWFLYPNQKRCKQKKYFLSAWKAKCTIFKAIVAGFRGKVA